MAFSFKLKGGVALYGAYAGIAAVAFAAAFAATFAAPSISAASAAIFGGGSSNAFDNLNRSRPLAALGSEQQCARYSGLPARWRDDPRAGMVHLHGGDFVFGSKLGYEDERPAGDGNTHVAGFWIDQTDVTNAQFAAFVRATGYVSDAERQGGAVVFHTPTREEMNARDLAWWSWVKGAAWNHPSGPGSNLDGRMNQPVTMVTQADALAYAHWLGRDLPTEAEWEYAGKAGHQGADLDTAPRDAHGKPGANYWQGVFPVLDTGEDGHVGLSPVGCYAANDFRLYDMIGNAWEWTKDVYTGPHQSHTNGDTAAVAPLGRRHDTPMVIKGGSFLCARDYCVRYRAASREQQEADLPASHIGFRTVSRDAA
ncbi:formylglycine-generating enzyme family protein [Paraburkholderia sprentiae WSM5005]|uniref:Formylglycine-generating enzyme family protein n=1 Tax=Paraburkholderia sprentiae WSM5005 TaxID=754502 RepID=A0A1L1PHL2_9BURK|nr:formylglycine-generating enzyme family protein [Paraburkholderia sprentiae]APA88385.1 formylglycine-generating enzyme family protein [Paraburkholderia sprentiae WSM5005]